MLKFLHVFRTNEEGAQVPLPEPRAKLDAELSAEEQAHFAGRGRETEEAHLIRVARIALERDALVEAGKRILAKEGASAKA